MCKERKRIGIMGGTFDPIHIGHLILGETAYEQFHLDQVLFMPAGNPPHKRNRSNRATDEQRTEMVKIAIASSDCFVDLQSLVNDRMRQYMRRRDSHPNTIG